METAERSQAGATQFTVHQLRFVTEAAAPLRLPPHKGSSLRGALFEALRAQFCLDPHACGTPRIASGCPVCFLLAPVQEGAPRGRDLPRPYVLRPPADGRTDYQPGERFEFSFLTFGRALGHFPYALLGVQEMGRRGLGAGRGGFRLQEVWAENPLLGRQERLLPWLVWGQFTDVGKYADHGNGWYELGTSPPGPLSNPWRGGGTGRGLGARPPGGEGPG